MDTHTRHPLVEAKALFERFPHLERVEQLWGSPECRELLADLMLDDRDGGRAGFPPESASLILLLLQEHDRQFPACDQSRLRHAGWTDDDAVRNRWR